MRRLLSLVLLAAFGFPVVAPAFALGQDTESSLPACCRRSGAHHCSMGNMQRQSTSAPALSEHCPCFPQPSTSPSQITNFALAHARQTTAMNFLASAAPQQAETHGRISRARSHQKRGPPAVSLA